LGNQEAVKGVFMGGGKLIALAGSAMVLLTAVERRLGSANHQINTLVSRR